MARKKVTDPDLEPDPALDTVSALGPGWHGMAYMAQLNCDTFYT